MSHDPVEDLRSEIAKGRVLAIVGAGVSIAATEGKQPVASWTGLLKDGVERCVAVAQSLPARWRERTLEDIESGDLQDLLAAAEKVSGKLGAPKGGEFAKWLRDCFESLQATDRSLLEALHDLGIPLATTNYDGLLEEVTGLRPVTWREGAKVERVIRSDGRAILHLHGYWEDPESVILGIRSYEKVLGDAHAQNIQRTLRTVQTLLFIGCGDGLEDPNFGALLEWTQGIFAGSEYRHYRLCKASERDDLQVKHPPEERILVLPYGPNHPDLAPFLRSLKPPAEPPAAASERKPFRLPPPPRCFGREAEVEDLVGTLCAGSPPPTPVLGPPGIGKSTITLAALHHPRVAERFGARRYFVRCEGAKSRDALVGEIATALRIEPGSQIEARLFQALETSPVLLILDNTETPWNEDRVAVEELLSQLGAISNLALVASIRGGQRPFGPNWRGTIYVGPLSLAAARNAFLAIAGEQYEADPDLDRLIEAVDRLPLAITLFSYRAESEPDLALLWKRWQEERTELLRRGTGESRLENWEVSLELSIKGPRMTEGARRLLALLGFLPDGIAPGDLEALLPKGGTAAASTLRKVGLALAYDPRVRTLAPVREYVRRVYPPMLEDLNRSTRHYLSLARLGEKMGFEGGAEAARRLTPETGNLHSVLSENLGQDDPEEAIRSSVALGKFFRFTGLGGTELLESARKISHKDGKRVLEAECLVALGNIVFSRSEDEAASEFYRQAFSLYQAIDDSFGQAHCIRHLGDIAQIRRDHETAGRKYLEALALFERIRSELGRADCIYGLGRVSVSQGAYEAAQAKFNEALSLYQNNKGLMGQARCTGGLGDLALRRSDYIEARRCFQEALVLFERVGQLLGYANCLQAIGEVARREEAYSESWRWFNEALGLYEKIHEPYSIGWVHVRLARLPSDSEERRGHVEAARAAWTRIKRPDLVEELDVEFGPPEVQGPGVG